MKHKCLVEGCDKEYSRGADLRRHARVAHEGARYVCNVCNVSCSSTGNLARHKQTTHRGEEGEGGANEARANAAGADEARVGGERADEVEGERGANALDMDAAGEEIIEVVPDFVVDGGVIEGMPDFKMGCARRCAKKVC